MVALGDRLLRQVRAIPGVTAATQMVTPPMLGNGVWQIRYGVDGQSDADVGTNPLFATDLVGPEFFRTFGIGVDRGRAFTERDDASSPLVAIVRESVARRLWPGRDPIGQRIRVPGASPKNLIGGDAWRTIVGVAHDTHPRTLREVSPMVFLPSLQGFWQDSIAIRSTTDLQALVPALRAAGREAGSDVSLWSPQTMDKIPPSRSHGRGSARCWRRASGSPRSCSRRSGCSA